LGRRGPKVEPREIRLRGGCGVVPLSRGFEAIVDPADAAEVGRWNWYVHRTATGKRYAARTEHEGALSGRTIALGRQILGFPVGNVRYGDGDPLNCRRSNLRVAAGRKDRR
jgi:hypothetical protein